MGALFSSCFGARAEKKDGVSHSMKDFHIHKYLDWSDHPVRMKYEPEYCVGEGAFASVYKATHIQSGQPVALKVLFKQKPGLQPRHVLILRREANYLRQLHHPNIVGLKQIFENPKQLVLVLEYLRGGELLQHLHEIESYTEASAARLFRQVVSGLQELHSNQLLHRDLKPENIVFSKSVKESQKHGEALKVKLLDLGMACRYSEQNQVRGVLGSPGFVAPEIISGGVHTPAMDVFALGVLLFLLLCGRYPMNTQQAQKLSYACLEATEYPGMSEDMWHKTSEPAKELITSMLSRDPGARPTCADILAHTWVVTEGGEKPRDVGAEVAAKASRAHARLRFRGLVQTVMLVNYAQSTIQRLRSASLDSRLSEDEPCVRVELSVDGSTKHVGVHIASAASPRLAAASVGNPSTLPDAEEAEAAGAAPRGVHLFGKPREHVSPAPGASTSETKGTPPSPLPMQELFEKWQAACRDARQRREAAQRSLQEQLLAAVPLAKSDVAFDGPSFRRAGDRFAAVVAAAMPATALFRRMKATGSKHQVRRDGSGRSLYTDVMCDQADDRDMDNLDSGDADLGRHLDTSPATFPERLMLANANYLIGREELRELMEGADVAHSVVQLVDSEGARAGAYRESGVGGSPFMHVALKPKPHSQAEQSRETPRPRSKYTHTG